MGQSDVRPWGTWEVLDEGRDYKVKRLVVKPRQRLSYQTHAYRSEHWVVVSGTATYILDGVKRTAGPGDTVDVPMGAAHRLINEHQVPLVVIEVQRGRYLGEDDIVRLQDDYGRGGVLIESVGRLVDSRL